MQHRNNGNIKQHITEDKLTKIIVCYLFNENNLEYHGTI
jgi:hypothetical protein